MIEIKGKACSVKMIEDSISPDGKRLTTLQMTYPRYIHAEVMTHRVFSRNASSSRAVPVAKLIDRALSEMVEPIRYGANQTGMQAQLSNLEGEKLERARQVWKRMAQVCADGARELAEIGLHKQWANRPLEWFSNISIIVTATELDNFFELRDHPDAQPEIQDLARTMKTVMAASEPRLLQPGEWHLPFVTDFERLVFDVELLPKVSAARCARVSYLTHDGQAPSIEKDLELFDRLVGSRPLHASPVEHQATPDRMSSFFYGDASGDVDVMEDWEQPLYHGNFVGWIQYRKHIEAEFAAA